MWDPSSLTSDGTHVSCIGTQILNHWTTREVPDLGIFKVLLRGLSCSILISLVHLSVNLSQCYPLEWGKSSIRPNCVKETDQNTSQNHL